MIIQIGDILISEEVVLEYFSCDYGVCRGKCCIEGDSGAPLDEDEPTLLERQYPSFSGFMTEPGRQSVKANGFFIIDRDGDMVTPLISSGAEVGTTPSEACAFCHFGPQGECLCSIEKSGGTKPRSCSLYPIRVINFKGGGQGLNLHRWDICKCAFEKGRREGVRVYEFLRKPLTDIYGASFWDALDAAAKHLSE